MDFSESLPEGGIINTPKLAPATTDASSEFSQFPDGGNLASSDELIAQGSGGCASDTKRPPRRMRARDGKICPIDPLQLNDGEEKGPQSPPTAPNAQQGGGGPDSGENGKPKRRVLFPPKDDTMSYLFMPLENRPKPDSNICPDSMHPVPVCARPINAYALMYPESPGLTIDPCYPCTFFSALSFFHEKSHNNLLVFNRQLKINTEDLHAQTRPLKAVHPAQLATVVLRQLLHMHL